MDYQLREDHFVVLETHEAFVKAGAANPFLPPKITEPMPRPSPIKNGHIEDWDSLYAVWKRMLAMLKIKKARNHSPVLLSIPSTLTRPERERIVQIFFERFNVPGLYLADGPLMSLYGYGQHLTGLVVDIRRSQICVVPVVDAACLNNAIVVTEVGSDHVRNYLSSLIALEHPNVPVDSESGDGREALVEAILKGTSAITDSQAAAEVYPTPLVDEQGKSRREREIQRVPVTFGSAKTTVTVGEPRLKAMEILFNPKLGGLSGRSLPEAVCEALNLCDYERRMALLEHVIITGDLSQTRGLKERLSRELKKLLPQSDFTSDLQPRKAEFANMPDYIEKYKEREVDVSFLGASIVAKLIFGDMKNYFTKLDYNESGPAIVRTKGY